jgi:hypothetical protein
MSDDSVIYEWIDEHEDELMEREELDITDFIEMFGSEERGAVGYAYWESIISEVEAEEKGILDRVVDAIKGGIDRIVGFIRGIFK